MIERNWYWMGYSDYPEHTFYPTQDRYTPDDETLYIKGWNRAKFEENCEDVDFIGSNNLTGYIQERENKIQNV